MAGLTRRMWFFFVLITFIPLGVAAAELDDYYLEQFGALYGNHKQVTLLSSAYEGAMGERCLTPLYHGLKRDYKNLSGETQKALAKYLAKPALSGTEALYVSAQGHFLIHYTTAGRDAAPLTDANGNSVPDWVETVAAVFEFTYSRETGATGGTLGYNPAPTLSGKPYDVYLQEISQAREFGYTQADTQTAPGSNSYTSYIVIDNDFANSVYIPYSGLQGLQLTAAHEYHHAIQYGYNFFFDIWYAEATATWIEDEVYDSINQIYNYLPASLQNSTLSLDTTVSVSTGGGYGRWPFNRHLAERYGVNIIRTIWERLATLSSPDNNADIPMLPVIDDVLKNNAGSLESDFFSFTKKLYTRNWTTHINDIGNIPAIVPVATYSRYPVTIATFPAPSVTLVHDAFAYFTFIPTATAPQNLVLSLSKNEGISAVAFKKTAGGAITEYQLDSGTKTITIAGFNAANTAEVALLIANNSAQDSQTANFSTDDSAPLPPSDSGSGGGCFIATAAYGSYLHPQVVNLRQFRDRYLLTNAPGRAFTALYYRLSPPLADVIARHDALRFLCRALLTPIIIAVAHPLFSLLLLTVLTILLVKRRREAQVNV